MPLFELDEGPHRRFYRIDLDGTRVHLHWGRIGSPGEHRFLGFETEALARAEYERQLARRRERGYHRVLDEGLPHDPEAATEAARRARLGQTVPLSESPRFLFADRRRARLAWVEARGAELYAAEGPRADEGALVPAITDCGSPAAAVRARDARIAELLAAGWELETFAASEPAARRAPRPQLRANPELEAVVAAAPEDEQAWLVLEDWLLEQPDDPRAELVALEKAGERSEAAAVRERHLPLLFGPRHVTLDRVLGDLDWRAGYLRACTFHQPRRNVDTALAGLAAAPAARLLVALGIEGDGERLGRWCAALADAPFTRSLRALQLAARWRLAGRVTLDAGDLAVFPELDRLRLLAPIGLRSCERLARLRALSTIVEWPGDLEALLAAPPPRLELLTLGLRELLARDSLPAGRLVEAPLPALRALHLRGLDPATAREVLVALRGSSLLSRLRVLALGPREVAPSTIRGCEHLAELAVPHGF